MYFYRDVKLLGGFKGDDPGGYETSASQADPVSNPTIVDGDLDGNDGAGTYSDNCVFSGNRAEPADPSGNSADGGAIYSDSAIDITNSVFDENHSLGQKGAGGAVFVYQALARIANCTFVGNTATIPSASTHSGFGGAVALQYANASSRIANSLFSGNAATDYGGAVYADNGMAMHQCTLTANDANAGGGVWLGANASEIHNSILWHNTSSASSTLDDQYILDGSASITVTYCDIEGISSGTGNVSADPSFVDANGVDNVAGTVDDDCRLLSSSPCISAGDGTIRPADTNDVDGDNNFSELHPLDLDGGLRVVCIMEMGAYERVAARCAGDLDEDGDVDASDLAILLGQWGGHGISDLDCDGDVDAGDLAILLGAWGDCPGYEAARATTESSAVEVASVMSPAELAESFGFGSVADFAAWLSGLDWEQIVDALAPLAGH